MTSLLLPIVLLASQLGIVHLSSSDSFNDRTTMDLDRTLSISPIPEDVNVGEITLGSNRLIYTYINSSNIVTVMAVGVLGLVAVAVGLYLYDLYLGEGSSKRNDNVDEASFDYYDPYGYAALYDPTTRIRKRSAPSDYGFNALNVLQWINMATEMYENFDYDDLECQKRLICEVMREDETFGKVSGRMKKGFQLAKYLEVLNMPDDFRELLDEYLDASERADGQKECQEFFQCPYSLKQSVKRNLSGNSL